jgi:hypothetical protein
MSAAPPVTTSMRDAGYAISPQWMRAYWFSRIMYSLWVQYDALLDAGGYAVLAGLPSRAPLDALQWIAKDRQIFQGPNEPVAAYIARLQQWLDLWRHAGSSTGILLALRSYVAPLTPKMLTVQSAGDGSLTSWDTYDNGEAPFPPGASHPTPPDHYVAKTANWRWDGLSQPYYYPWMRWRKWVVIFQPPGDPQTQWAAPTATWAPASGTVTTSVVSDPVFGTVYQGSGGSGSNASEFAWDDGTCWDWTGTPQDAASLTRLARQWKSAGVWVPWIIVTYDATMFDETLLFTSPKLPDGHWGYWGKVVSDATFGTVYTASRPASSTCSLLAGTADGGGPGIVLGVG